MTTMFQTKVKPATMRKSIPNKALIMVHGRGGNADDILSLADHLDVKDFALLAPQAASHSWYPLSFLARPEQNEPALSTSLKVLNDLVIDTLAGGVEKKNIYFLGFSQGACLVLEFVTRNAAVYGGIVAYTGGLIGDRIYLQNYNGDFAGTPVFIGTCAQDPHVPLERVYATATVMRQMNAVVTDKVYNHIGHSINKDELEKANSLIFNKRYHY
jgi:phospholipase/carboxylesterase